jgi:hypothetical protein
MPLIAIVLGGAALLLVGIVLWIVLGNISDRKFEAKVKAAIREEEDMIQRMHNLGRHEH